MLYTHVISYCLVYMGIDPGYRPAVYMIIIKILYELYTIYAALAAVFTTHKRDDTRMVQDFSLSASA